jgi:YidC/Oxa1 family membrane protein insertase
MIGFFETIIYQPLYNGLVFLAYFMPWADIGFAVITLTLIVKFALFPLMHTTTKSQVKMREIEPELNKLKEDLKDDKEKQARELIALYNKHGINPATGCVSLLIQLPIILGLYWVFKDIQFDPAVVGEMVGNGVRAAGAFLNEALLYPFTPRPEYLHTEFLGFIDMTGRSILLAVLAGITQYFQMKFSMPDEKPTLQNTGSLKDDLIQNMKFQMRYVFPFFVVIFAYTISSAIALYWVISNMFAIGHEWYVRREYERSKEGVQESAA